MPLLCHIEFMKVEHARSSVCCESVHVVHVFATNLQPMASISVDIHARGDATLNLDCLLMLIGTKSLWSKFINTGWQVHMATRPHLPCMHQVARQVV